MKTYQPDGFIEYTGKDKRRLHVIVRPFMMRMVDGRVNLTDTKDPLQVGVIEFTSPTSVERHWHSATDPSAAMVATQEVWVVLDGKAIVNFYDVDNTLIGTEEIQTGDIVITFEGGHALHTAKLTLFECKNGPYRPTKQTF